jgi:hypothetical protein
MYMSSQYLAQSRAKRSLNSNGEPLVSLVPKPFLRSLPAPAWLEM